MLNHLLCVAAALFYSCGDSRYLSIIPESIEGIPPPAGYHHIHGKDSLFSKWLLNQKLRKDNTIYLYNDKEKGNQSEHVAVLDIEIGNRDLLQCADAAMKLRADFLFQSRRRNEIWFRATSGEVYDLTNWNSTYEAFMQKVYSFCGSYSLDKQLKRVVNPADIQPGDVFIKGGFPGHCVIVVAVSQNSQGKRVFLLAQGFMPAQDIHILKNPANEDGSPWYNTENMFPLHTPLWSFYEGSLKRW